ncbi:MAG: hypothetical protein AAFV59_01810 [Pseudomonadota bacterium]
METVSICFSVPDYMSAETAAHQLGNIADGIWPEMILVDRSEPSDRGYRLIMRVMRERPMRKKERDELIQRVRSLAKSDPMLEPEIQFPSQEKL